MFDGSGPPPAVTAAEALCLLKLLAGDAVVSGGITSRRYHGVTPRAGNELDHRDAASCCGNWSRGETGEEFDAR